MRIGNGKVIIKKENFKVILWAIVTGILLKPGSISALGWIDFDNLLDNLKIVISICVFIVWCFRSKKDNYVFIALLYPVINLLITVIHNGDVFHALSYGTPVITFSVLMSWGKKDRTILEGMYLLQIIYCVINLIVILRYPNGWYITANGWEKNYFLGFKTILPIYLIPTIALGFYFYYESKNVVHFVVIAIACVQPFLEWTAGAIICVSVIIIGYVLCKLSFHIASLIGNIRFAIITLLLGNLLLVGTNIYTWFTLFFVEVLHKSGDMTGRIYFWAEYKREIARRILLGHGYLTENNIRIISRAPHPHNYLLGICFTSGILGLISYVVVLIYIEKKTRKVMQTEIYVMLSFCLLAFYIAGFAESFYNILGVPIVFGLINFLPQSIERGNYK